MTDNVIGHGGHGGGWFGCDARLADGISVISLT